MTEPARTVRVLLVDDAVFMRSMAREILDEKEGFEVVAEASSGAEAVLRYQELAPDLVLMDLVMPEMDGVEATRRILAIDPSAVVVVCSAQGQEAPIIESIAAGAKDFLIKPFSHREVLDLLSSVLAP